MPTPRGTRCSAGTSSSLVRRGRTSRVDDCGFAADRAALGAYLSSLSAVSAAQYAGWSKPQQYAFLANAYNAFTAEKILTRWPNIKSIRDFGTLIGNPWKDRFFTLLGRPQHLDGIEHETMRAAGVFDEPRVHVAVNCASIGCPLLDRKALLGTSAAALDAQLEDLMRRFMADRTRNRYNAQTNTLELSKIFDWYGDDFRKGGKSFLGYAGFGSVSEVGARYADLLADGEAERALLRAQQAKVAFLDYDWSLNAAGR
ncbi:MAG: DUF547 domain-containing protein [Burkholderiaceae bacterium]|nr:DUF547 domain-containing protein [Burkholderiaceae bacterium]